MNEKHLKHSGPRRISGRSDRNDTFIFANNGPVSCRFIPADGSGSGSRSGKRCTRRRGRRRRWDGRAEDGFSDFATGTIITGGGAGRRLRMSSAAEIARNRCRRLGCCRRGRPRPAAEKFLRRGSPGRERRILLLVEFSPPRRNHFRLLDCSDIFIDFSYFDCRRLDVLQMDPPRKDFLLFFRRRRRRLFLLIGQRNRCSGMDGRSGRQDNNRRFRL